MRFHALGILLMLVTSLFMSCQKEVTQPLYYYEVGIRENHSDWRDSSFVVATRNPQLIEEIERELLLPVSGRKMIFGTVVPGSGGYNKNADHLFNWHLKEDEWELAERSAEIYDGRPYSDVDADIEYWTKKMTRYAPWNSYIKKRILHQETKGNYTGLIPLIL